MSITDPIDQVAQDAQGQDLGAAAVAAESASAFFEEMAGVQADDIERSAGAGMGEPALFEACKAAGVPGLVIAGEVMGADDMRRALVVVAKRAAVAPTPVDQIPPAPVPIVPATEPPAPAPEPVGMDGLDPSRNGRYTVRIDGRTEGGGRRMISMHGAMQAVVAGGKVDLASHERRHVEAMLRAPGLELVPEEPLFVRVEIRAKLDAGLDVDEFRRELEESAEDIARGMAKAKRAREARAGKAAKVGGRG